MELIPLVKSLIQSWADVPEESLAIRPLLGGLTNKLFICSRKDNNDEVIVRLFGKGTETFFSREDEHTIFEALSDSGFGPKLHGYWPEGRIEGFVHGQPLRVEQLSDPAISCLIARKIAQLHLLDNIPIDRQPSLFVSMRRWLAEAKTVCNAADRALERFQLLQELDVDRLEEEVNLLERHLTSFNSPVYMCHNDLQEANIMYDGNKIEVIDYEYGSFNYRGFDLANHFCEWSINNSHPEWPGFSHDPDLFPSQSQQEHFVRHYLSELRGCHVSQVEESEIRAVCAEAVHFSLASHLMWSIWGVCQGCKSEIAFGYLQYSATRLREYYRLKSILIA